MTRTNRTNAASRPKQSSDFLFSYKDKSIKPSVQISSDTISSFVFLFITFDAFAELTSSCYGIPHPWHASFIYREYCTTEENKIRKALSTTNAFLTLSLFYILSKSLDLTCTFVGADWYASRTCRPNSINSSTSIVLFTFFLLFVPFENKSRMENQC